MPRGCAAAGAAGVALVLTMAAVSSRHALGQQIEVDVRSGNIYAMKAVVPRLNSAVHTFMQRPFEMALDFTTAADSIGSLDLADRQQMSRLLYTQTLATKCGEPGNPFDMVYLGLEDGTFLGYFSPTVYTYRPPSGTMADQLSWEPYDLDSINGVCDQTPGACDFLGATDPSIAAKACIGDLATCGAADISGGAATDPWMRLNASRANCAAAGDCRFSAYGTRTWDGKVVSSSCARSGADMSICSTVNIEGGDASTDLHACESAGDCMYTPADVSSGTDEVCIAVCTDTCCDGDLRVYYTADSVGEPVEMTRWRVYDHRARPWYIQQKQRFLVTGEKFSWSGVYTFSTSGALGISATAMIHDDADSHGVAAIDYTLGTISQLITDELVGLGADLATTWSYIVEVDEGSTAGTLMASTTESVTARSAGSVTRLNALQSSHPGVALSAAYLDDNGWPEIDGVALSQGDIRVEIGTFSFVDRGLVWLIVAGQSTNCSSTDVWSYGECQTCDSGKQPADDVCVACASGFAGIGGICNACPDGKQPNEQRTVCETCPKGKAGKGGQCIQCDVHRGEVANSDVTTCVCPAGTYDSYVEQIPRLGYGSLGSQDGFVKEQHGHCEDALGIIAGPTSKDACDALSPAGTWISVYHISCWQRGRRDHPSLDSLNSPSIVHLADHSYERRCITCPSCLTCDSGMISINSGFSIAEKLRSSPCSGEGCEAESTLNVYKCESDGCPGFAANDTSALDCSEHHKGLLCGSCEQNYHLSRQQCIHCGEITTGAVVAIGSLIILINVWRAGKARIEPHGPLDRKIRFYRRVFEKSWPRFNQGWKILAGNFQISASIAANTHIEWPDGIGRFFDQMLLLPGILAACGLMYKYRVSVLLAQAPTKSDLLEQVAVDLALAVKIGQTKTSISSWAFMSVYLLYPGACREIFAMFKCRKLDHEASYLIADMRQACLTIDGSYDETYFIFMILASVCVVLFAFGIPFVLGLNLHQKRHVIAQNPNYVTLAAFKPLFQFYYPQCYMWEIYFMIQKVVLVAIMGIIQPSKFQKIVQVVMSIVVVCAICSSMPSKTQQFNYANIVSQGTIILNFLAAILLDEQNALDVGISADQIEIIVAAGMQIMMLYLIYVIVAKVKEMVVVSSREVNEELLAMKQLSSGGTDTQEDVGGQEAADAAVRLMFDFYDYDGGGSVNLYEIQHVLDLFGIKFNQDGRNAVIELAGQMAGHDAVCDELRKQFEKLDMDMNDNIDKPELKQALRNPEIDLSPFGWAVHQNYGDMSAIDVIFEEMDASANKFISWDEIYSACKQRLCVKSETLSQMQAQLHNTGENFLNIVIQQDKQFSKFLFPSGVDIETLDRAGIINACLDSSRPAEAMRSLLVRSRIKEDKQLLEMDAEGLKRIAKQVLVDDEIIEKFVATGDKATLLVEIARQKEEMSFETFKAIWTAHKSEASKNGSAKQATEKFRNPLVEADDANVHSSQRTQPE